MKLLTALLASTAIFIGQNNAIAQDANPSQFVKLTDGKTIYETGFFESFTPTNAMDMVAHVPGFSVQSGADLRGLAGTEGNVLIDGARQSTKGQSIEQYLTSIPAKSVERVEIWQGSALGTLGGRFTILLNIVRKKDAKSSGSLELKVGTWGNSKIKPSFDAKYSGKIRDFNYSFGLGHHVNQYEPRDGEEFLWDKNNALIESGKNYELQNPRDSNFSFATDGTIKGTKINANYEFTRFEYDRDWNNLVTKAGQNSANRFESGKDSNIDNAISFGLGLSRKIGKFDAKFDYSFKDNEGNFENSFGIDDFNSTPNFSLFKSFARLRENVAQLSLARKYGKHSVSFGGEAGRNSLDNHSNFYVGDGKAYDLVADSFSSTKVVETRYEAFFADTWEINPKISIESKLRLEKSHIGQIGDNEKDRDFTYIKPRLVLSYKPFNKLRINTSYERELGQLDFNDFAFQAQIIEGNNTKGNAELRPDKSDVFKMEFEKTWGKSGNLTFTLLYRNIQDAIASIPLFENGVMIGEGVGNIESAWRRGYSVSSKIPLDKISQGLEINASYNYRQSQIKDPFTHQNREYFMEGDGSYNIDISKNFEKQKLVLGAFLFHGERNQDLRSDSRYLWPNIDFWGLTGEYKGIKDYTLSLNYQIPAGIKVYRHRTIYETSRLVGDLANYQLRYRQIEPRIAFTIRRTV